MAENLPLDQGIDGDDVVDEDEMIDVAEQIFIRIAEAVQKQEIHSIRQVFQENIIDAEFDGQIVELLSPQGLLEGIRALGIDDLS